MKDIKKHIKYPLNIAEQPVNDGPALTSEASRILVWPYNRLRRILGRQRN